MRHNPAGAAVALGIALAIPLLAHHSTTMFVLDKQTTLEGIITEVAWGNPHSVLFLDAKPVEDPNAPVKNWSVEGPPPRRFSAMGVQKDTIKPGDKVKIMGFARKDGRAQILFIELTDAQGHRYGMKRSDYAGD